ncbi:MAG TPA: hypothetical protein VGE26_10045 [Sphingobacteriaceae bacterium]
MATKRTDILSILKEEKQFLEKQLKKVDTAIAAFSEDEAPAPKTGKKRGPKPGRKVITGKKRGRKPKTVAAAPDAETTGSETVGSPELG